jgi:hypothetical protein
MQHELEFIPAQNKEVYFSRTTASAKISSKVLPPSPDFTLEAEIDSYDDRLRYYKLRKWSTPDSVKFKFFESY